MYMHLKIDWNQQTSIKDIAIYLVLTQLYLIKGIIIFFNEIHFSPPLVYEFLCSTINHLKITHSSHMHFTTMLIYIDIFNISLASV